MATKMEIHELCLIFPPMSPEEFAGLKEDIAANGLREPVWTYRGKVIDGRNRARACDELGITPKTREWDGKGSIVEFVVSLNLHRRHLTSGQRATCGTEIEEQLATEAKERQRASGGDKKSLEAKAEKSVVARIPQPIKATPAPKARDRAAKLVGTNARYIQDAKTVKEKSPELYGKVKDGKISLPQAKRQVLRIEKRADLEIKAKAAPLSPDWQVIEGDCIELLPTLKAGSVRLIFADPPYNIGIDYGNGKQADMLEPYEYLSWCNRWINECCRVLADDGSFFLLCNHEHAAILELIVRGDVMISMRAGTAMEGLFEDLPGVALSVLSGMRRMHVRSWITWFESFGVNVANGFNRTSRRLFYFTKSPYQFTFNPGAVTRPSDRQAKYGDRRADPGGKTWDDVWGIKPPIPRLVGNHAERLPDFPTQVPLDLLRAVVGCASEPGDLVIDPFSGSGTTGAAAIELGRRYVGIEKSAEFAGISRQRLAAVPQRERNA